MPRDTRLKNRCLAKRVAKSKKITVLQKNQGTLVFRHTLQNPLPLFLKPEANCDFDLQTVKRNKVEWNLE